LFARDSRSGQQHNKGNITCFVCNNGSNNSSLTVANQSDFLKN
jgi:hypothetical protein